MILMKNTLNEENKIIEESNLHLLKKNKNQISQFTNYSVQLFLT